MPYFLWVAIAALALLPGIAASLVPGIPAIIYMLAVAAVFGYLDRFAHLSAVDVWVLAALAAITMLVDFVSGVIGAKWGGAHWSSILWGMAGLVIGAFLIPIPLIGSIIGMFLGILASEWHRTRDLRSAERAATGSLLGSLAGTGFKAVAAIAFTILFVVLALVQ